MARLDRMEGDREVAQVAATLVTTRKISDSQRRRDAENPISPKPNRPAAKGITRLNPITERRDASQIAPSSAPIPEAVNNRPKVWGPPWRTSPAKMRHHHGVRHADQTDHCQR